MFGISLILIGALLGAGLAANSRPAIPARLTIRRREPRAFPENRGRDHA